MIRRHSRIRVLPDSMFAQFFRAPAAANTRSLMEQAATPISFICIPDPLLEISLEIHTVAFSMVTEEIPQPDGFGGDAALTNGIEVGVFLDATDDLLFDFLDGETINTNEQLSQLAGNFKTVDPATPTGSAQNRWHLSFHWDVFEHTGAALLLAPGTQLRITLNDEITVDHALTFDALATGVYQK